MITVEVAYATPEVQKRILLTLSKPCSIGEAIQASGILTQCPEIDLTRQKVGIFNKIYSLQQLIKHNDRIEIYRPLIIDPKQARQLRVKASKR